MVPKMELCFDSCSLFLRVISSVLLAHTGLAPAKDEEGCFAELRQWQVHVPLVKAGCMALNSALCIYVTFE